MDLPLRPLSLPKVTFRSTWHVKRRCSPVLLLVCATTLLTLRFSPWPVPATIISATSRAIHEHRPGSPLTVVDLAYDQDSLERQGLYHDWIVHVMLGKVQRPLIDVVVKRVSASRGNAIPCAELPVYSDSLVILNVGSQRALHPVDYAGCVREAGAVNVGLVVTNSECPGTATADRPCAWGGWAQPLDHRNDALLFEYAFRNYMWTPLAAHAARRGGTLQFWPLGPARYTRQPVGRDTPASSRSRLCFFAGDQTHGDRPDMMRALHAADLPCVESGLRGRAYSDALADTVFALSPWGNNHETFRFWEALEYGAIPVLVRIADPREDFVSKTGIPLLLLESWSALAGALEKYQTHGSAASRGNILNNLQMRVQSAYRAYLTQVQEDTAVSIEAAFTRTRLRCNAETSALCGTGSPVLPSYG